MQAVALQFQLPVSKRFTAVKSDAIGTKLEWRGMGNAKALKPHAIIVQIVIKERDERVDNEKRHNLFGVLRVDLRNICLMAVVDEAANADALALARATADNEAPPSSAPVSGRRSSARKRDGRRKRSEHTGNSG